MQLACSKEHVLCWALGTQRGPRWAEIGEQFYEQLSGHEVRREWWREGESGWAGLLQTGTGYAVRAPQGNQPLEGPRGRVSPAEGRAGMEGPASQPARLLLHPWRWRPEPAGT